MDEGEARRLRLPGSDVYVKSHLAYGDPLHNAGMVAELCHEAYRAFLSTSLITHRVQRRQDGVAMAEWIGNGLVGEAPRSPFRQHYLRHFNIENLLIGTGFELSLKAKLLHEGYLVHELQREDPFRELARRQGSSPVKAEDLFTVEGYQFVLQSDGNHKNCLRGLTSRSISFKTMLSRPEYREVIDLDGRLRAIIDFYRELRNAIHLPGDVVDPPRELAGLDFEPTIVAYVNANVVEFANAQVRAQHLPDKMLLTPLEP